MTLTKEQIVELIEVSFPQAGKFGWSIESVGENRCCISLPLRDIHMRPGPTVSGPTLMTMADIAMYFAVLGSVGPEVLAVTTSLNIQFLRPMESGILLADALILKRGRRLIAGRVELFSEGEREALVAHATVTYSMP